jgi:8-oxo-dGTP pyrophosphatase MutT (NUDIX family)
MHRQPLLDLLDQYLTRHPAEGDTTLRYRDFVLRNPLCFERSLAEGHVTGSAWILNAEGDQTLLTHHRKLNLWLQPGGHADGNSDVLAVAMQECLEETGLTTLIPVDASIFDLDIHGIPAHKDVPAHYHYDVRFLVRHTGSGDFTVSPESHDLAWVPLDRLEDYTTGWSMRRMRDKAIRLR